MSAPAPLPSFDTASAPPHFPLQCGALRRTAISQSQPAGQVYPAQWILPSSNPAWLHFCATDRQHTLVQYYTSVSHPQHQQIRKSSPTFLCV